MQRYLVPILQVPSSGSEHLQQVWMFLERNGTHLIQLDAGEDEAAAIQAANEFCEVNELSQVGAPFCADVFVFVPIDPADKDLRAFYSWDETPPGTNPPCEAWRPFLWLRVPDSDKDDPWDVNAMLRSICIGDRPSLHVYAVLQAFWKGSTESRQTP
jgi:hypothetical protein